MTIEDFYLNTDRIPLRQYRQDDFNLILELNSDPEVMRYLTNGAPASLEETKAGVERTLFYQEKYRRKLGVYTAELMDSGEFFGLVPP